MSDFFKDKAKVVKTFSKVLGSEDVWNFDYYLHYGSGIFLNQIFEEGKFRRSSESQPVGYFFVVQSEGDPRVNITRTKDGQNFDGPSPGKFNYSFYK